MELQSYLPLDCPEETRFQKISVSMPVDLVHSLTVISKDLGISRSALLTVLLTPASEAMLELVAACPPDMRHDEAYARRFRGQSKQMIENLVAEILAEVS